MPIGTAFHERTFPLCESLSYREWSGYYTVSSYEPHHEHEYNAIRNAVALIDVSPLFKYLVRGRDATRLDGRGAEPALDPPQRIGARRHRRRRLRKGRGARRARADVRASSSPRRGGRH